MSTHINPLEGFAGQARLFPLPNLVLFPHASQPLHIFEPRYRQLLADALSTDRLIAMALLRPGWEEEYDQAPPIHSVVCLGRVEREERLPDGRFNLMLHGLIRARVVKEVKSKRLYRIAQVELLEDDPVPSEKREQALHERMTQKVLPFFSGNPQSREQARGLLESDIPLGVLCDIFSFALPLPLELKQHLLEEPRVEERARLLLRGLETEKPVEEDAEQPRRPFPPKFSSN